MKTSIHYILFALVAGCGANKASPSAVTAASSDDAASARELAACTQINGGTEGAVATLFGGALGTSAVVQFAPSADAPGGHATQFASCSGDFSTLQGRLAGVTCRESATSSELDPVFHIRQHGAIIHASYVHGQPIFPVDVDFDCTAVDLDKAPADTAGFDVKYSRIATTFALTQLWDGDSYSISFDWLASDDWQISEELQQALGLGTTLSGISLSGEGSACSYAPEDPTLVLCDLRTNTPIRLSAEGGSVTATARNVTLTIQKISRTSLNDGPFGQYVSTFSVIEVEFDALTDQGRVRGVVEFVEGLGGTTIRQ